MDVDMDIIQDMEVHIDGIIQDGPILMQQAIFKEEEKHIKKFKGLILDVKNVILSWTKQMMRSIKRCLN